MSARNQTRPANWLSPQQRQFLQGLELGMPEMDAVRYAKYKDPAVSICTLRKNPKVKAEMERIQAMHREEMSVTRSKVQKIVLEAIEMGRLIADPNAMVRGAAELNKMCGFYAPEKKILELGERAQQFKDRMESMPEDELLRILDEDGLDIEGEFTEIPDEE